MKRRLTLGVVLLALAAPAAAHHGVTNMDATKAVTVRGAVADVDWRNPHVVLLIDVPTSGGSTEPWTVAIAPPHGMERMGLTQESVKKGAIVSATGYVSTIQPRSMSANEFTLPDATTHQTANKDFRPIGAAPKRYASVRLKPDTTHVPIAA